MATRALLHRLDKSLFLNWLEHQGWVITAPKGAYEAIRARRNGEWLIVYDRDRGDHFSVRDQDYRVVRSFYHSKATRDGTPGQWAAAGKG